MDKAQLQKALISILIGAAIMALNQIIGVLLEFIQHHYDVVIPTVTGMVHYLGKWKTDLTA